MSVAGRSFSRIISPNDWMWKTGEAWYFDAGLSALACVRRAMGGAVPAAILDLPCGHGRVCRMLRAAYPSAHITASDIDRDAVDFCAREFEAAGAYGTPDVRNLTIDRRFDLIWCGSLLTHLRRLEWPPWLQFFGDHLSDQGRLVFTTHGQQSVRWMEDGTYDYGLTRDQQRAWIAQYEAEGFGWVEPTGQTYGHSLSTREFVTGVVGAIPTIVFEGFAEAGWAAHHDVFVCRRAHDEEARSDVPARSPVSVPAGETWCPCCRTPAVFVEHGPWLRDQYVCETCGSIPRHRAVNHVLDTYFPAWTTMAIYEAAPSNDFISRHASRYTCSQFLDDVPPGTVRDGVRCEDLERLTFDAAAFDLVITKDVMEHVFRPDRALRDIMRVLRPGGAHVFTAPRLGDRPESRPRAAMEGGAVVHLAAPDYHGNPVGDGRALVTWDYGRDAEARFSEWSGHPAASYVTRDRRLGLDGECLDVFVVRKPAT